MKSKQVIVIRKDLNMRKGKMVAQGSHASMKVILDMMTKQMMPTSPHCNWDDDVEVRTLVLPNESALHNWLNGPFTKVCVSVDSEEELLNLLNEAEQLKVPCTLITDAGLTEFDSVPTNTCIAIGPAWEDDVNKITGHLKLL